MKKTKHLSIILTVAAVLAVSLSLFIFVGCDTNKEVTLTFMLGNEVHMQITGKSDSELGEEINLPVKTGYEFKGWKTSDGAAYTQLDKLPKTNTTVYADMQPIIYSVKFNPNGGTTGKEETQVAVYDQAIVLTDQIKSFSRSGYDLTGFAYSRTAETADFRLDGEIKNLTTVAGETVTLYAYYTARANENGFVIDGDTILAYVGKDESVTLPEDCTKVAQGAFSGNMTIREVYVPETYTEIGFEAFKGCNNIEKMTLPFIGESAEENTFLAYIFGAMSYTENKFSYQLVSSGNTTEVDENSLSGTFFIPRSLRTVVINSPLTEIGEGAFYFAYGLEKVMAYSFADDPANENEMPEYSYRITKVGKSAFEGCHRLGYDSITKADYYMAWLSGVEEIGDRAFIGYVSANDYYASNLSIIGTLENVRTIGDEAFMQCNGISSVAFGDKLERIGKDAFSHAYSIQRVVIPDSCKYIGESAFEQCLYLSSVTIGSGVETIGSKAFSSSISLTEVIFEGNLPAGVPADAFYGASINNGALSLLTSVNPGTVFYFTDNAAKTAAESKLTGLYNGITVALAHEESAPYYYIDGDYGFWMTFSKGHTAVIHDPYMRTGFGIPEIVGPCDRKTDTLYNAQIYEFTIMNQYKFLIKLDYNLTSYQTHYYQYKINSFTLEEALAADTHVTIGERGAEWQIAENKYGQVALYHNGTLVGLDEEKGAAYVYGGVVQTYGDGSLRTYVYYQGNAYFEPVVEWYFVYAPDENIADEALTYYGTLTKVDDENDYTNVLYGYYRSIDSDVRLSVDAHTGKLEISQGANNNTLYKGAFTVNSNAAFGDAEYTVSAAADGKTYSVKFTDLLEQATDGNTHRDVYARAILTVDGKEYVLYNTAAVASSTSYYINADGDRIENDYYVLIQYESADSDGNAVYTGYGEHFYTEGNTDKHDVLSYVYDLSGEMPIYRFTVEGNGSEFTATGNGYLGDFSIENRKYASYYAEEAGKTYINGDVSITLSGYGRAVYTDAAGVEHKGSYGITSGNVVMQLFVSSSDYYNMLEYAFISDDGNIIEYFVPGMYDSYDGTVKEGDMILPDEMRGKEYRIYDEPSGYCTGIFFATGYGMGALYIMVNPNTLMITHIDDYNINPAGATYAYYTKIGDYDGQPYYCLANPYGTGFFMFTPTEELAYGKNSSDMGSTPAYTMWIDPDYMDWWLDSAALLVTGIIDPSDDEFVQIESREEKGVYTSPNGYTLTLDGLGNATLKSANGQPVHTATYKSKNAGIYNADSYPFEYTVGDTAYSGAITVFDTVNYNGTAIVIDGLTIDGVALNLFVKGEGNSYTGDYGKVTIYDGGRASILNSDGKAEFGTAEKVSDTEYVCRFDSQKLTLTVSGGTYAAERQGVKTVKNGMYLATYFYFAKQNGGSDEYSYGDYYGYEVRYNNNRPVSNTSSIYVGTAVVTKADGDNVFYFDGDDGETKIVVYEDGDVLLTYWQYGLIEVKCSGKYVETDKETLIILCDGDDVVTYKLG